MRQKFLSLFIAFIGALILDMLINVLFIEAEARRHNYLFVCDYKDPHEGLTEKKMGDIF